MSSDRIDIGRWRVPAQFWSNVSVRGAHACWMWRGRRNRDGYGIFTTRSPEAPATHSAHRVAWGLRHGTAIPSGMCVLHHCDEPGCVNPDHLYAGTHSDNMRDARLRSRFSGRVGENNTNSKLTAAAVRAIRREYASGGVSQEALSAKWGVSSASVSNIVRGQSWAHVGGPIYCGTRTRRKGAR